MASRRILVLGNITSIILTIVAFLQLLSWTIAGILILTILTVSTLTPSRDRASGGVRAPSRKSMIHAASVELKQRERTVEKTVSHTHPGLPKIESKPTPRHEPVRLVAPQAKPEPERTSPPSPTRPGQAKLEPIKTVPPKIVPPKTIPSTFSPSKPIPSKQDVSKQEPSRPIIPKINLGNKPFMASVDSGKVPTIGRGDYESYDVELEEGSEVTCRVTSTGPVNVYLLNEDNLNSLDTGEEFWSETGEEDVENAVLSFTAPEKGKWFLVVENAGSKEISANVNIEKNAAATSSAQDSTMRRPVKSGLG